MVKLNCRLIFTFLLLFLISNISVLFAQVPNLSSLTAAGTLSAAAQAFSKSVPVHQVTLTGTVNWTAGSENESGNTTLVANADGSYQITLDLGQGPRTETQSSFAQGQQCTWSGTDGVQHATAVHNCLLPVAWFLPSVALFGGQQPSGFSSSIIETSANAQSNGIDLRQQQLVGPPSADTETDSLFAHLTASDIIFDPVTYLPVALSYNLHPDTNAATDIPVQVEFFNYQTIQGIAVPLKIQRYINGMLDTDITVSAVTWN